MSDQVLSDTWVWSSGVACRLGSKRQWSLILVSKAHRILFNSPFFNHFLIHRSSYNWEIRCRQTQPTTDFFFLFLAIRSSGVICNSFISLTKRFNEYKKKREGEVKSLLCESKDFLIYPRGWQSIGKLTTYSMSSSGFESLEGRHLGFNWWPQTV